MHGRHHAELPGHDHLHGFDAQPRAEHPVEGRGIAAPLEMSQHEVPRLLARALLDHLGEDQGDADLLLAFLHVSEFVEDFVFLHFFRKLIVLCALGHGDDGVVFPLLVPLVHRRAHFVYIERNFGDQDYVRAAGHPSVQGDPSRVAAHDLHHHHPFVGPRGGVQPVQRLHHPVDCGVEPEGVVRSADVVVNGLGHAHDLSACVVELLGHTQRVVSAHGDQGVDVHLGQVLLDDLEAVFHFAYVGARGTEDRAPEAMNILHIRQREHAIVFFQHALPAQFEADDLVLFPDRFDGNGADDGVEARSVSAAGQDADFLHAFLLLSFDGLKRVCRWIEADAPQ